MLFSFTPDQEFMRRTVRDFAAKEITPHVDEWEAKSHFPRDLVGKFGELGLTGMVCPEEYGGTNLDRVTIAIVAEELGRAYRAASFVMIHNMVLSYVVKHGTDEQKERWAAPLARGEKLAAFALTESGSGSDSAAMVTRAVPDGDYYVLNGGKRFITNADSADVLSVATKTDPSKGSRGVSVILVEKGTPGMSIPKIEDKIAMHGSHTCEVVFEDCRVPRANLLGAEGEGFKILMGALDGGRVNVGAIAVGGAQAALDVALSYARERVQFGRPIAEFQAIQFMLADMATELEAARLLVYAAASLIDQGKPATKLCAMAKRFATDMAMKVTTDAVQVLGGYGLMQEYKVERYMREAKIGQIVEGTNQIQRLVIARELLKG